MAALPAEVLQSLLGSETLLAASEVEVAQVRTMTFESCRETAMSQMLYILALSVLLPLTGGCVLA